eukprot:4751070-Amphidinium_carterae.1
MEPPSKKAKVLSLQSRLPYISQSGLAALLREAKKCTLPSASRTDIRDARNSLTQETTPYGCLHQIISLAMNDGAEFQLEVQSPFAMMYYLTLKSSSFGKLIQQAHMRLPSSPQSPWHFILYSDEVTPGNQLLHVNARQLQVLYWSLLEFGMDVLSEEESWLEVAICRSSIVQKLKGGMSSLVATALKLCWGTKTHDFMTSCIHLMLPDGTALRVFVKFAIKLADEGALHQAFGCKGASGLKPCMLCNNIFNSKTGRDIEFADETWAQSHTSCLLEGHELSKCQLHSEATVAAVFKRLRSAREDGISARDFEDLQTKLGWSLIDGNIMQDEQLFGTLKVTEQVMCDWMHILFVGGVFNVHMRVMMLELKGHGVTYETLHAYINLWTWPARVGSLTGKQCCSAKHASSSWKKQQVLVRDGSHHHVVAVGQNFLQLVLVIELIEAAAKGISSAPGGVTPNRLRDAIEQYIKTFKLLFGEDRIIPKYHYLMHLPVFLHRWGCLPNCFVLERKHKEPKRYAQAVSNTSKAYESTVLREVTSRHVTVLCDDKSRHFGREACIFNPVKPHVAFLQALKAGKLIKLTPIPWPGM